MTSSIKNTFINLTNTYLSKLLNSDNYQINDFYIDNYFVHIHIFDLPLKDISYNKDNNIFLNRIKCKNVHIISNFTFTDINCNIDSINLNVNLNLSSLYFTCDEIPEISELSQIKKDLSSFLEELFSNIKINVKKINCVFNSIPFTLENIYFSNKKTIKIDNIQSEIIQLTEIDFNTSKLKINTIDIVNLDNLISFFPILHLIESNDSPKIIINVDKILISDIIVSEVKISSNYFIKSVKYKTVDIINLNNLGELINIKIDKISDIFSITNKLKNISSLKNKIRKKSASEQIGTFNLHILFNLSNSIIEIESRIMLLNEIVKLYSLKINNSDYVINTKKIIINASTFQTNVNNLQIFLFNEKIIEIDLLILERSSNILNLALSGVILNITNYKKILDILFFYKNKLEIDFNSNNESKISTNIYFKNCELYYKFICLNSELISYNYNEQIQKIYSRDIQIKLDNNTFSVINTLDLILCEDNINLSIFELSLFLQKDKLKNLILEITSLVNNKNEIKHTKKILKSVINSEISVIEDYIPTINYNIVTITNTKITTEYKFELLIYGFKYNDKDNINRVIIDNYVLLNGNSKEWKSMISNMKVVNSVYFLFSKNTLNLSIATIYIYLEETQIPIIEEFVKNYIQIFKSKELTIFKSIYISELRINLNYQPSEPTISVKDMDIVFPKYENYNYINTDEFTEQYLNLVKKNFDIKDKKKFLKHLNVVRPLKLVIDSFKKSAKKINDGYIKTGIEICENIFEYLIK